MEQYEGKHIVYKQKNPKKQIKRILISQYKEKNELSVNRIKTPLNLNGRWVKQDWNYDYI